MLTDQEATTMLAKRRFGYYIHRDDGMMDFLVAAERLSAAGLIEFHEHTGVLLELQPITLALGVVELNHQELVDSLETQRSHLNELPLRLVAAGTLALDFLPAAAQKLGNLLASVNTFLDQTRRNLGRTFGPESAELAQWDDARRLLHSRRFSYRFLYELRNFSQHIALPISRLSLEGARLAEGGPMIFEVRVLMSREGLLSEGFDWKKVRPEIEARPEDFDVMPLVHEHMNSMRQLLLDAIEQQRQRLERCAQYLDVVLQGLRPPQNAVPVLVSADWEPAQGPPKKFDLIPVSQLMRLLHLERRLKDALVNHH